MSPGIYLLLAAASAGAYWAVGWAVRRAYDHTRQHGGHR